MKAKETFWFILFVTGVVIEADILSYKSGPEITQKDGRVITRLCQSNTTLMISGSVLKLSDIPPKENRKCNDSIQPEAKIIELFATEKVIFDRDLDEVGEDLNLVVISPSWEVEGERKINLDGVSQKAVESQAEKGNVSNYNGAHGKSGSPGGPGGRFYGVGKSFINTEKLTISANGGNGEPGQKGGDGADGVDKNCTKDCQNVDAKDAEKEINAGGRGGNGGIGGRGGKAGEVIIINLENPNKIGVKISTSDGSAGAGGSGGKGGKMIGSLKSAPNGQPAKSNLGFRYPQKRTEFKFFKIVNHFKFYAQCYLINSTDTSFQNFYDLLENQDLIKNSFSTSAFVNEFYFLQFFQTKPKLLPFYQSLHRRLKDYQKNRNQIEQTTEYEVVLENLEKNLSSIISGSGLNESIGDLNTDIKELKERIKDRIAIRERVHQRGEVLSTIASLQYKFTEIRNFLSRGIQEKFDNFVENVEEKIERLISEPWMSKDNETRYKHLLRKLEERFSLQSIYFIKLGIEFTVPMTFMTLISNLYHLPVAKDENNLEFLIPTEVQESYQEVRNDYDNYVKKRVEIIKNHTILIKEKKQDALNPLAQLLENLMKNLTSSNWIKKDPFKSEMEILLKEEGKLNLLSGNEIPLQVIRNLKLDSKCAQVLGESYERFASKGMLDEIGKVVSEAEYNFKYLEDARKILFEEILPYLDDFRPKLGMSKDSITSIPKVRRGQWMILNSFLGQIDEEAISITYRDWNDGSYDFFTRDLRRATEVLQEMQTQLYYINKNVNDKFHLTSDVYLSYSWALLDLNQQSNAIFDLFSKILTKYDLPNKEQNIRPLEKNWKDFGQKTCMINDTLTDSEIRQIEPFLDQVSVKSSGK